MRRTKITKEYRDLGHEYKYIALSYTWGSLPPSEDIEIRNSGPENLRLRVTPNLYAALKQLRDTRVDRTFWVDAVCMNQDDKAEKNQQLPLMPRIYGEASKVYVWLGNEDPKIDASAAFTLIRKVRQWEQYKEIVEKHTSCEEWDAFISLMNRDWFRRRWIVQDIVLAGADRAEIWWGSKHIPWIEFAQAVALFEGGLQSRVKEKFRDNKKYENHPDMFGDIQEFNATRLVKVTAEIVSRRDDGRVVRKRESLESLISTLTPFDAGQAHDIVYAVLSLAKDVSAGPPTVTLKTELRLDDLPRDMRIGCDLHSPKPDSSKLLVVVPQAAFLIVGAIFLYRSLSLSWNELEGHALIFSNSRGVKFWILVGAVVLFTLKLMEYTIRRVFRSILQMSSIDSAIKVVRYLFRKYREFQTRRAPKTGIRNSRSTQSNASQCDCERKLRILNNVMRRLRLEKFPVDYDKGFDAVCDDLYTFTTLQSMSLDLIFRPWCPEAPKKRLMPDGTEKWLPTWVRPLSDRAFKPDSENHMQRSNGDILVGEPGTSPYQASGKFRTGWIFKRDGETQILSARGFQLDVIKSIADVAEAGIVPKKWLKEYRKSLRNEDEKIVEHIPPRSGNDKTSREIVSTEFWRTMIAGKGPNGQNPPLSYSLVCQELFNSEDAINLISKRDRSTNTVLKEFIDRVLAVIWGRKLARTKKLGRLALLPYETEIEKHDVICILYGCSVPVVLRKIEEKTSDGEDMWELIGECYVYEMMAGEALAERRSRIDAEPSFYRDRVFNIR